MSLFFFKDLDGENVTFDCTKRITVSQTNQVSRSQARRGDTGTTGGNAVSGNTVINLQGVQTNSKSLTQQDNLTVKQLTDKLTKMSDYGHKFTLWMDQDDEMLSDYKNCTIADFTVTRDVFLNAVTVTMTVVQMWSDQKVEGAKYQPSDNTKLEGGSTPEGVGKRGTKIKLDEERKKEMLAQITSYFGR